VFVIVYLDDILIFSADPASHVHHVSQVLEQLLEWGLFCKLEKCEFSVTKVGFLGYVVSTTGVNMDLERVDTIRHWPTPRTTREVLSFLGFCNFYRRFIHDYSGIASGMTAILKGKAPFAWTEEAQRAFLRLKDAFSKAPLLVHFNPVLPITLECDASIVALSGILSQTQTDTHRHPIAFYSRKLIPAEVNYGTFDQELLAIVESAKH
jgi:hypothetical protein